MLKIYIASPYTKGDVAVNVKRQLDCANELMDLGFAPFAPLYSHFQHMAHPRPYEDWIKLDLEWVKVCDCVLRLEGESKGADGEVTLARELGKKIFYSVDELRMFNEATKGLNTKPIPVEDCRHYNAYYFHDNARPYCPDCHSYPESIYQSKS